jgi:tetratricopeptide (TPR) repeat protein
MKVKILPSLLAAALILGISSGHASFARTTEKTTEKAREAVENAGPHDWYTLAASAEKCFKKKVNLKEASEWLDQSLEIAQMPYNLELKGDYYIVNKLPEQALEFYLRAINVMKEQDGKADVSKIQKKISEIINIGG